MRLRLLALASLAVMACARTDKLADVPVQSATLDHFFVASLDMLGGGTIGGAQLHIVEPGGTKRDVPLQIAGGEVGPMMDVAVGKENFGTATFDLSHVKNAHGIDLLGPYAGYVVEGGVLLGGSYYELENDRRARFKLGGFDMALGLEMFVGQEWLTFDVAPPDAGPARDDAGPSDDAGVIEDAGSIEDAGASDAGVDGGVP